MNIKYSLPTALSWIAWWSFKKDVEEGYGDYSDWYAYVGYAVVFVGLLFVFIPGFFPYKEDAKDTK